MKKYWYILKSNCGHDDRWDDDGDTYIMLATDIREARERVSMTPDDKTFVGGRVSRSFANVIAKTATQLHMLDDPRY